MDLAGDQLPGERAAGQRRWGGQAGRQAGRQEEEEGIAGGVQARHLHLQRAVHSVAEAAAADGARPPVSTHQSNPVRRTRQKHPIG